MLKRIFNHPRAILGFYSSIMRKNITPILLELLQGDLADIRENILIFDREFNTEMIQSNYYKKLAVNSWDTYRDLQKVFDSQICQMVGFGQENTLMIDSESEKVQLWIENALIVNQYVKEDAEKLSLN